MFQLSYFRAHQNPSYHCWICLSRTQNAFQICDKCIQLLPKSTTPCIRCGNDMSIDDNPNTHYTSTKDIVCNECIKNPPKRSSTICSFNYQFPINKMVLSLKFNKHFNAIPFFVHQMKQTILKADQPLPDIVTPIPLHPYRVLQRGFNQSSLISQPLAKALNINHQLLLSRKKHTRFQKQLSKSARKKNASDIFSLKTKDCIKGKRIALIDDILTTGSTIESAANVLIQQGAKEVYAWVIAYSKPNN